MKLKWWHKLTGLRPKGWHQYLYRMGREAERKGWLIDVPRCAYNDSDTRTFIQGLRDEDLRNDTRA